MDSAKAWAYGDVMVSSISSRTQQQPRQNSLAALTGARAGAAD